METSNVATSGAATRDQVRSVAGDGFAERTSMNRVAQYFCIWCGPLMILLFLIGSVWLGRFFPPAIHPRWSAARVAQFYFHHVDRIRIGLMVTMCAYGVMATWGCAMATHTRRKEGAFPTWTYVQLVNMAAGTAQIVVMVGAWAAAAYRPGAIDPGITQTLNDVGWLLLEGTWITFTIWSVALGMQILTDRSAVPVFPRWSGYVSIAAGLGYTLGSGPWFAKSGAFSWVGAVSLWFVFFEFGAWVLLFTWLSYKNLKRGWVHEQEIAGPGSRGEGMSHGLVADAA
jgi:hypothetical protein